MSNLGRTTTWFACACLGFMGLQPVLANPVLQDDGAVTNTSPALSNGVPARAELEDGHGTRFVVVPGPSYSPSLGWGLMLLPMAMFNVDPADEVSPASSLAGFLMFTENDSYVAGIGPKLYLDRDTWRVNGKAGYGNIKQDFYGIGAVDPDEHVPMTSEVIMAEGAALRHVWPNVYVGPLLQYRQSRFLGDTDEADAVLEASGLNADYNHNIIPGLMAQYDTREHQVEPRAGMSVEMDLRGSSEELGSTSTYQRMGTLYSQFATLWNDPRHVLAWMATVETGYGDVPFDEYPDLGGQQALRGYVKGEFTDKNMIATQVEYRWDAWKQLGFTLFGGTGKVFPAWDEVEESDWLPAGGVGLRYLVIPEQRMNARLDLAWGELGFNFYFSVGEAF